MGDVLNIKVVPFRDYITLWGGWQGWAKTVFARAFVEGNSDNRLGVPKNTIVVLAGYEKNLKLMAHEAGHVWGLDHPMWGTSKGWFGKLIGHIVGAAMAGFPVMSAYGILRHKDKEGLVARYEAAQKVYL